MIRFAPIIMILLFTLSLQAATDKDKDKEQLRIEKEGHLVTVVDFQDGDKIKLFEAETGIHILSKSFGIVDLSQLPNGKYVTPRPGLRGRGKSNKGRSIHHTINGRRMESLAARCRFS